MDIHGRIQNLALIVALVASSSLLLRPTIRFAFRIGLVDKPDRIRKVHEKSTAYMGGGILWVGLAVALSVGCGLDGIRQFGPVLAALSILFATGIVDDAFDLAPRTKFVFQTAAVAILVVDRFSQLPGFGWSFEMLAGMSVMVVVGVGVVNAFNLIDGLDGLALGLGILTATPLFLVAWQSGERVGATLGLAFVAAATGMLRGNLHPARIFLGDAGSLLIGGVIFALAMRITIPDAGLAASLAGWIVPLVVSVPVVDMAVVVVSRHRRGAPLFKGDRSHLHHRLLGLGLSHEQAVGWIHASMSLAVVVEVGFRMLGVSGLWSLCLLGLWVAVYRSIAEMENEMAVTRKEALYVP